MRREEPINKKLLAIIIAITITILLIIISIKKIMDSGKILTSIKFTPDNATIIIDDNKVSNNSEVLLTKGKFVLDDLFSKHLIYEEKPFIL